MHLLYNLYNQISALLPSQSQRAKITTPSAPQPAVQQQTPQTRAPPPSKKMTAEQVAQAIRTGQMVEMLIGSLSIDKQFLESD